MRVARLGAGVVVGRSAGADVRSGRGRCPGAAAPSSVAGVGGLRRRPPRAAAPSPSRQAFIGACRGTTSTRRVYPARRFASVPRPDPFGARASLGAGLPDYWRLAALGDRIDLDARPRHAQDPAREHAPQRRRRADRPGRRRDPRLVAARLERPTPRSRSCRRASCSRTSPACPRSSTSRRCATRWPTSAATRRASTRWSPRTSSSTTRSRSTSSGRPAAFAFNVAREYERNGERYQLLRWAQTAFRDLRVVPPGTGIVHQVNLEFLATVVADRADEDGRPHRLPGHGRRDRLAHHDDQRPRRAGLGRRRHRGRGGAARPADLHADAARRRRPPVRRAAARARPPPTSSSSSPRCSAVVRRRRRVRRVRRRRAGRRCRSPTGRRSRT